MSLSPMANDGFVFVGGLDAVGHRLVTEWLRIGQVSLEMDFVIAYSRRSATTPTCNYFWKESMGREMKAIIEMH